MNASEKNADLLMATSALPNGSRLSCGALVKIHSLIYARRQLQALVRRRPRARAVQWWQEPLSRTETSLRCTLGGRRGTVGPNPISGERTQSRVPNRGEVRHGTRA